MIKKLIACILSFSFAFSVIAPTISASAQVVENSKTEFVLTDEQESEVQELHNSLNNRQTRAIPIAAILAWVGKVAGAYLAKVVAQVGLYEACRRYNDANWGMDTVCDAMNFFRD
ncbi:MAG: hypothetical protein ACRDD4_12820 [Culicoidibacterales bacterium]